MRHIMPRAEKNQSNIYRGFPTVFESHVCAAEGALAPFESPHTPLATPVAPGVSFAKGFSSCLGELPVIGRDLVGEPVSEFVRDFDGALDFGAPAEESTELPKFPPAEVFVPPEAIPTPFCARTIRESAYELSISEDIAL